MSCPFYNNSESYEFTNDEASYGKMAKRKFLSKATKRLLQSVGEEAVSPFLGVGGGW